MSNRTAKFTFSHQRCDYNRSQVTHKVVLELN